MAYVRVQEWTAVQVADWFSGLDDRLRPYASTFLNNGINGHRLMMLAPDDLINLNITKLGHQELILEMVEQLQYSYFHLNDENLQWLDLRLSCKAHSLYNDLRSQKRNAELKETKKQDQVATSTLSAVADLLTSVKVLVSWLERPPFAHQTDHVEMRQELLRLSVDLATISQRDKFAEQPNDAIEDIVHKISQMCDKLLQENKDPLIIQPVSLEVATIKKKANEELGIHIQTLYSGVHIIGRVKAKSPAFNCRRIEAGDEIVQVNCQTVVAWPLKRLVAAMKEDPVEVVLTLKKRPRHSTQFGRILTQHFFIVSKKMTPKVQRKKSGPKVNGKIAPLTVQPSQPSVMAINLVAHGAETTTEDEDEESVFLSEVVDSQLSAVDEHLDIPKLHVALQRRATITGASPTSERPPVRMDELWQEARRDQLMRSMSHDITGSGYRAQLKRQGEPQSPRDFSQLEDPDILREKRGDLHLPRLPRSPCRPVTCIGGGDIGMEIRVRGQESLLQEHPQLVKEEQPDQHPKSPAAEKTHQEETNHATDLLQVPRTFPDLIPSCHVGQSNARYTTSQTLVVKDNRIAPAAEALPVEKCAAKVDIFSEGKSDFHCAKDVPQKTAEEEKEVFKSYQVVVVGGVPQRHSSSDSKPLSSPSPVFRRKRKIREIANRRISCKDLGRGDCQGWLYRGQLTKKLLHHYKWTKRWCVLKDSGFYVYKDDCSNKAECFICLNGFNCSPAVECKSKKYAFKVYHSGTTFYFASDSQADMAKWMNKMGLAAIDYDTHMCVTTSGFTTLSRQQQNEAQENLYYSETDEESEEAVTSPESMHSAKTSALRHSPSSSSLSSSSSYYSPMESPLSPSLDSGSSPGSLRQQRDAHGGSSSDSFGEVRREEDARPLQREKCTELRVNAAHSYAVTTYPASPHYTSIHLQTVRSEQKPTASVFNYYEANNPYVEHDLDYPEAINACFVPHVHSHPNAVHPYAPRGGTLPALPSARREPPARLVKGTSLEWKCHSEGATIEALPSIGGISEQAKMSLAFEMNLDSSPPKEGDPAGVPTRRRHSSASSQASQDSVRSLKMSALRLFGSPKFVRKLKGQGEAKKAGKPTWHVEPPAAASRMDGAEAKPAHGKAESAGERRFLGSPKLARALYRAIHHKKAPITEDPGNPLVARRLSDNPKPMVDTLNFKMLQDIRISSIPSHPEDGSGDKTAAVEAHDPGASKPAGLKVDVTAAKAAADAPSGGDSVPGTPRTPLKPAMGVSMIGKQRRSSSQSSSEAMPPPPPPQTPLSQARTLHQCYSHSTTMASQATQTDSGRKTVAVDDLARLVQTLHDADLHLDGTRLSWRRQNSAYRPHPNLRYSKKLLRLRALKRTLNAKERDLKAIDDLLESKITSESLKEWKASFPYVLKPHDYK